MEAAANGVPSVVVAGSDNAAVELVEEGVNGAIATSTEPGDLAAAIVRVHDLGPALRRSTTEWYGPTRIGSRSTRRWQRSFVSMPTADARVLHVLPHPGGGGETYVAMLEGMTGYVPARTYIAPSPRVLTAIAPALASIVRIPLAASGCDLLHVHGEVAGALCLPALLGDPLWSRFTA